MENVKIFVPLAPFLESGETFGPLLKKSKLNA
jgi:hypothetical protein